MAMRRLLLSLVMATLFFSQGFSVAAAVCQHRSVRDHAMARESRDRAVAAAAFAEESAASVVEKKGSSFGSLTSTAAAVLPSIVRADRAQEVSGTQPWYTTEGPELGRRATEPLLRPPLA